MGLPLTAINRLVTPTGTPDMVLAGGGITNVATTMTVDASPGVPANVPATGTVRALIYNTGDTNPEFIDIDLGSRSTLTFTIARETEESTARAKCAHSAGAGIWFVGTAAMFNGLDGGGALVLLEQHDAASSADLRFTSFVNDALYSEYLVTLDHVVPVTNNVNFLLRCSTDGGATYDSGSNYSTVGAYGYTGGVGVDGVSSDSATAIALLSTISNDAHWGINGDLHLRGLSNTAVFTLLNGQTMMFHATLSKILEGANTGAYKVTTAVNALQFFFSSGNIASGTIRIYGVPRR